MNSRNMPEEEELDNMFRQAADSFEPEFDPEAWRQMEQKLDATSRKPAAFGNWARKSLLALLLLLSGWVVYHLAQRETGPSSVQNKTIQSNTPPMAGTPAPIAPEKASSGNREPLLAENLAGNASATNLPVTREQTNQPTRLLRRPNAPSLSASRRKGASVRLGKQIESNRLVQPQILNNNLAGISKNLKNDAAPGQDSTLTVAENGVPTTSDPALTPGAEDSPVDSTTNQAELKEAIPESSVVLSDAAKTKPSVTADPALQKIPATFLSKVSMSLVLGPDFSTVKFVRPEKASTNVGVMLSYSFGRRWAISTGLVRARKVYGAKPEDYHMKPGYWPAGHLPDEINAVCKVLDIPLNVRYAVVVLPRQTIYVQTGLSSYIMLHEDYRYDYSNYGKPYSKHWIVPDQNRHFFQVLNLSVGYSKQIKPGISVGAEPFAKIPLAGIGAGKVNLMSLGAFFSVGYRFR
jgi:hypothetical protein